MKLLKKEKKQWRINLHYLSDKKFEEIQNIQKINHEMIDLLRSQLSIIIQFSKRNNIPLDRFYETISLIRKSGNILNSDQPTGNINNNYRRGNST